MSRVRLCAMAVLGIIFSAVLLADFVAPASYAKQFREAPSAAPSIKHWLGTDELGRDSFSRLLYGSRVSLLLAPAAALLSTLLAASIGGLAGYLGGWYERLALAATDLSLSLPWLFLLLTVRALLPLNVAPVTSVTITFALLGVLGWSSSGRIICSGARAIREADFVLQAKALGCRPHRLFFRQVLPNLKPLLSAQFWTSIPIFIIAEANLGILGLGVSEPLPSWGNLLRGLENWPEVKASPWKLAPVLTLLLVLGCFQLVFEKREEIAL
jgi:ABC-type dipeptide/oligopeptide/nickel transport system permease subunit